MSTILESSPTITPIRKSIAAEPQITPDGQLPPEFVAVPLTAHQIAAPIRICVIARREADPSDGQLLVRRDLMDSKVYLGCIRDVHGMLELVELWVQDLERFAATSRSIALCREAMNNTVVDERWKKQFELSIRAWPQSMLTCGWELHNPPPTFLDVQRGAPFHPGSAEGPWELCRDDRLLMARGLPPFSTTLHRYLHQPKRAGETKFAPVLSESPRNETTVEIDSLLPEGARLVRFNPGGGYVRLRPAAAARLDELIPVLGGGEWKGIRHGKSLIRVGPISDPGPRASDTGGWLHAGRPSQNGSRYVEAFHLKLKLLADMIDDVAALTKATQRPLLNLTPASFVVRGDAPGNAFPHLWTLRGNLVDFGDAVPLEIPQGEARYKYHLPGRTVGMSMYQPGLLARQIHEGVGRFFAQSKADHRLGFQLSGTFTTGPDMRPAKNDIVRLRLNISNTRHDLYVKIDQREQLTPGEMEFISVPQQFPRATQQAFESVIGIPQYDVPFEFYPLLSSACDLYSLGVLATQVMLEHPKQPVAKALGNVLRLASAVKETHNPAVGLSSRIRAIFEKDKRFMDLLGPQFLIQDSVTAEQAARFLPIDLWFDLLAMIVKMFAGTGPDNRCAHFGDVDDGGLHLVYDGPIQELDSLLTRSRSLLMIDWDFNRQVNNALREMIDAMS